MSRTCYTLFHGNEWRAESANFAWLRNEAMRAHGSHQLKLRGVDVFILPRKLDAR
jgi:hypothetical protein